MNKKIIIMALLASGSSLFTMEQSLDDQLIEAVQKKDSSKKAFFAINPDYHEVIKVIALGANPNAQDKRGRTPLIIIAGEIEFFLSYLDRTMRSKVSPCGTCLDDNEIKKISRTVQPYIDNSVAILKFLLEHRADPNIQDNAGETPLFKIISHILPSTTEPIELLLKYGADPSIENKFGSTVLDNLQREGPEFDGIRRMLENAMGRKKPREQKKKASPKPQKKTSPKSQKKASPPQTKKSAIESHYTTLGVAQNASQNQIKAAFNKLAMKYHPDKVQGSPKEAEQLFIQARQAYDVLSDPDKRRNYDASLK